MALPAALAAQGRVGVFDGHTDIGRVSRPGSASFDSATQTYVVTGGGANMWNDRDAFHMVWARLTGDFILSARARFSGAGVEPHRKLGWTIRRSFDTGASHVTAAVHGDGLASLQFRRSPGGITEEVKEYAPDGAYIYFNSVRTGRMQLWRMRPDGSDQRQLTSDGFDNWFPHISPDGRWIAFLSFPPDVPAGDHPFYKHVLLPHADRWRCVARHRLCVRWPGDHQRAVVVARWTSAGIREQLRPALTLRLRSASR